MNLEDQSFVEKCLQFGVIKSPCLEVGVGVDGAGLRWLLEPKGIEYFGADMNEHKEVDFVFNLEDDLTSIKAATRHQTFSSILILNVLEHTFEPIQVLDKMFALLSVGGTCIIIVPAVWPLHDWPMDCWRILPNFYEQYAQRRGYKLHPSLFDYVGNKGSITSASPYTFPNPSKSKAHYWRSRLIHKIFATFGRGVEFSNYLSIGVVIEKTS
jgi:SAM-dependent methyltransferase